MYTMGGRILSEGPATRLNLYPKKASILWVRIIKNRYLYMLILPALVLVIIFNYLPMYGALLAFQKFEYGKNLFSFKFVGLDNFEYLFKQADFWRAFKNTVIIGVCKFAIGFTPPIILALMLNELRAAWYKKFIQSVLYLPYFLSWVIVSGIVYSMLSSSAGIYGKMFMEMGIKVDPILGNPNFFRPLIYITEVWKYAGWGTIIYLAAISGINPELYESAELDGAKRFKKVWYITLPSIKSTVLILLILNFGGIMEAGFDQIFNLYSTSVYSVGDIIDTYVYRLGIRSAKYDISAAAGLIKSAINCAMLVTANFVVKLFGEEGFY